MRLLQIWPPTLSNMHAKLLFCGVNQSCVSWSVRTRARVRPSPRMSSAETSRRERAKERESLSRRVPPPPRRRLSVAPSAPILLLRPSLSLSLAASFALSFPLHSFSLGPTVLPTHSVPLSSKSGPPLLPPHSLAVRPTALQERREGVSWAPRAR